MLATVTDLARRTRQHHAIEHAALQILAGRAPGQRIMGLSDPWGFTVAGTVETAAVRRAVSDAMLRLQAGEHQLAIHPNCGTNLATTALLSTLAAFVGGRGTDALVERFLRAVLFVIPALLVAGPLGLRLQRLSTLAEIDGRWLVDVRSVQAGGVQLHRVVFE